MKERYYCNCTHLPLDLPLLIYNEASTLPVTITVKLGLATPALSALVVLPAVAVALELEVLDKVLAKGGAARLLNVQEHHYVGIAEVKLDAAAAAVVGKDLVKVDEIFRHLVDLRGQAVEADEHALSPVVDKVEQQAQSQQYGRQYACSATRAFSWRVLVGLPPENSRRQRRRGGTVGSIRHRIIE